MLPRAALLLPLALVPARVDQDAEPIPTPAGSEATVEVFSTELAGGTGGVEVDAAGNVYVSDFGAQLGGGTPGDKVFRITPDGAQSVFAQGFRGASGSAIGPDGTFFQANIAGNSISRITAAGEISPFLSEKLRSPVGIAVDEDGLLFVANCGSASILEVSPEGAAEVFVTSPLLSCPNGITLDPEHNLYVANFNNGDVLKITPWAEISRLATLPGNNNGHLVYRDGFLYVVARGAHQIYRVSLEGEVTLLAGTGERGHADGPALEATFSYPNDLAFSPDGEFLYVNENASTTEPHTVLAPMLVRRITVAPQ